MDIMEAMKTRHSVRRYLDRPIEEAILEKLRAEIADCNRQSGLNIQLVTDEPEAFSGFMASYGKFENVRYYIALVGPKGRDLDEKLGWYGERILLKATMLGLSSCWVALTFSKSKCGCTIGPGEVLRCVIALGYGQTQGVPHKSKSMETLCRSDGLPDEIPDWFIAGMEAAILAPTATNQQKFMFTHSGDTVQARATGGFYSKVDLGIVKYHFETGAGKDNFRWV